MEVSINKKREILIKHLLKPNETYKVSDRGYFKSVSIYKKPQIVSGFSNICEDGKGVIVIDYDGVDKEIILEDYRIIQDRYNLPQAYLFGTKKDNYHVICLKKFKQSEIYEILQHTRCDDMFKSMPLRNSKRSYVLRLSEKRGSNKPKFIEFIGKENPFWGEISNAHQLMIHKIYPKIPYFLYKGRLDKSTKLKLQKYETR